jgi:MFS family permease
MAQTRQDSAYDVLKIPDYRSYIIARTCIVFGINVLATAVGWQVYEITQDALSLGIIGLAEFIPFVIVTLIGGYIADIFDRRNIILTCVFLYALCTISLLLYTEGVFKGIDNQQIMPIYVIIGLTGLVRGFLSPAQTAFAAQLVPNELFANAATWSTVSWQVAAIGGPAVGGLLCAFSKSAWSSYAVTSVLAVVGLFLIWMIKSRHEAQNTEGGKIIEKKGSSVMEGISNFFESVKEGLRFVFKNQIILGSLALDMFAVLFGGAVALLPAFAKDVLAVGPEGFGMLRAAPAVGALTMAVILTKYPPTKAAGKQLLVAVAGFGICTILFALSKNFWFSLVMLAGTGFFDTVSMVIRGTIVQLYTPNDMRGRVSSVNSLFIGSSNELGAFESGLAARLMGLVPSVIFGGIMTLVVVATAWWRAPKLREMDLR